MKDNNLNSKNIYAGILKRAVRETLVSYKRGDVKLKKEADLQAYLYHKCIHFFKEKGFKQPYEISLGKRINKYYPDLILGNDDALIELKLETSDSVYNSVVFDEDIKKDIKKLEFFQKNGIENLYFLMIDVNGVHLEMFEKKAWVKEVGTNGMFYYCFFKYEEGYYKNDNLIFTLTTNDLKLDLRTIKCPECETELDVDIFEDFLLCKKCGSEIIADKENPVVKNKGNIDKIINFAEKALNKSNFDDANCYYEIALNLDKENFKVIYGKRLIDLIKKVNTFNFDNFDINIADVLKIFEDIKENVYGNESYELIKSLSVTAKNYLYQKFYDFFKYFNDKITKESFDIFFRKLKTIVDTLIKLKKINREILILSYSFWFFSIIIIRFPELKKEIIEKYILIEKFIDELNDESEKIIIDDFDTKVFCPNCGFLFKS